MIKLFVCSDNASMSQQVIEGLRAAGADLVEALQLDRDLKLPAKLPRDNRYVFVCESPAAKLVELTPTGLSQEDYAAELTRWYQAQSVLLAAYEKHPQKALLTTALTVGTDLDGLIHSINQRWGQTLRTRRKLASPALDYPAQTEPMLGYLVQNLIKQTPQLRKMSSAIANYAGLEVKVFHEVQALENYRQTQNGLDARLQDATEEGELILLQLHQVQEELEHYFLKYKDAENQHERLLHRWRQMLNRYPDYVDVDFVEVEPIRGGQALRWRFEHLESAGVSKKDLSFETFIESGVLGVRFSKTSDTPQTLARWPKVAEDLETIECIPTGRGEVQVFRAGVLKELSSSDWAMLTLIPNIVIQALDERPRRGIYVDQVKLAANRLRDALAALPKTLRYDGLTLKNHQTNPDYEHLWVEFENLLFGEQRWPKFEMRLGASNIQGAKFSQHPKIEIPLIDGQTKPFEGWFEESIDDFGGKWELRFDLKKQIMDASIWGDLDKHEQSLIKALTVELMQNGLQDIESGFKRGNQDQWKKAFNQCVELLSL